MCVSLFYRTYRQFRLMRIATASGHAHFCCVRHLYARTPTPATAVELCVRMQCRARRHTAKHCLCTKLRSTQFSNIRQIFAKLSGGVCVEWNAQTIVEQRVIFLHARARLCVALFGRDTGGNFIHFAGCASIVASVNLMKTEERDANKSYANSNYPSLRRPF